MEVFRHRAGRCLFRLLPLVAFALLEFSSVVATAQSDGPLVGAVTDTSAKVFARTSARGSVVIEYSTDSLMGTVEGTAAIQTARKSDFTTIVPLTGLIAETAYSYRVVVDGVAQQTPPYPSFTTFPPAGSPRDFVFAVLADLDYVPDNHPAPVYAKVNADQPAFVLQIGDFDHRNPLTLSLMRIFRRQVRGGTYPAGIDFANNIAKSFPFFHVWDDHDYGTNDSDKTFASRASAWQAFKEYYPLPELPNASAGIWHKFSYGQAEFFMLDLRSQRDPDLSPAGPDKSMLDGDNIPNGQKQWLKDSLLASTATWKFIVTSVPFNPTSKRVPQDAWSGFMDERAELLDFIDQNGIAGVILISGDIHSGGGIDNGSISGRPEISVAHTNLANGNSGFLGRWSEGIIDGNDGNSGYALIHVTANPDQVLLEAKGTDGSVRISYLVASP